MRIAVESFTRSLHLTCGFMRRNADSRLRPRCAWDQFESRVVGVYRRAFRCVSESDVRRFVTGRFARGGGVGGWEQALDGLSDSSDQPRRLGCRDLQDDSAVGLLSYQRQHVRARVCVGRFDHAGGVFMESPVDGCGGRAEVAAPGVGRAEHGAVVRKPAGRLGRGELPGLLAAAHLSGAGLVFPAGRSAMVVVELAVAVRLGRSRTQVWLDPAGEPGRSRVGDHVREIHRGYGRVPPGVRSADE